MSIDARNDFISAVTEKMGDVLTVNQMNKLNEIMFEESQNYEITKFESTDYECGDLLTTYLNAISVEGKTYLTIKRYKYIISRMLKKVQTPTNKITINIIRDYFVSEKNRGISERTLENERQIYHRYFRWLYREGLLRKDPLSNLATIKYEKKVKDVFSDTDIEIIKSKCKNERNLAIVMFMLSTGCRVGEVVNMNLSNIDFVNFECHVYGKGKKERIVYLDEVTVMYIKDYLKTRTDNDPYLFRSRLNKRISKCGIEKMLKVIERNSNVVNIHPHKFRRTLATNLIKRGMPIQDVAKILGHDKIETTMQYIVLDNTDIKYSYRKFK